MPAPLMVSLKSLIPWSRGGDEVVDVRKGDLIPINDRMVLTEDDIIPDTDSGDGKLELANKEGPDKKDTNNRADAIKATIASTPAPAVKDETDKNVDDTSNDPRYSATIISDVQKPVSIDQTIDHEPDETKLYAATHASTDTPQAPRSPIAQALSEPQESYQIAGYTVNVAEVLNNTTQLKKALKEPANDSKNRKTYFASKSVMSNAFQLKTLLLRELIKLKEEKGSLGKNMDELVEFFQKNDGLLVKSHLNDYLEWVNKHFPHKMLLIPASPFSQLKNEEYLMECCEQFNFKNRDIEEYTTMSLSDELGILSKNFENEEPNYSDVVLHNNGETTKVRLATAGDIVLDHDSQLQEDTQAPHFATKEVILDASPTLYRFLVKMGDIKRRAPELYEKFSEPARDLVEAFTRNQPQGLMVSDMTNFWHYIFDDNSMSSGERRERLIGNNASPFALAVFASKYKPKKHREMTALASESERWIGKVKFCPIFDAILRKYDGDIQAINHEAIRDLVNRGVEVKKCDEDGIETIQRVSVPDWVFDRIYQVQEEEKLSSERDRLNAKLDRANKLWNAAFNPGDISWKRKKFQPNPILATALTAATALGVGSWLNWNEETQRQGETTISEIQQVQDYAVPYTVGKNEREVLARVISSRLEAFIIDSKNAKNLNLAILDPKLKRVYNTKSITLNKTETQKMESLKQFFKESFGEIEVGNKLVHSIDENRETKFILVDGERLYKDEAYREEVFRNNGLDVEFATEQYKQRQDLYRQYIETSKKKKSDRIAPIPVIGIHGVKPLEDSSLWGKIVEAGYHARHLTGDQVGYYQRVQPSPVIIVDNDVWKMVRQKGQEGILNKEQILMSNRFTLSLCNELDYLQQMQRSTASQIQNARRLHVDSETLDSTILSNLESYYGDKDVYGRFTGDLKFNKTMLSKNLRRRNAINLVEKRRKEIDARKAKAVAKYEEQQKTVSKKEKEPPKSTLASGCDEEK